MTLAELLAELEARGVRIEVIGGRLRLEASPGAAPAWLLAALVEHRAELLSSLRAGPSTARPNEEPPAQVPPAPRQRGEGGAGEPWRIPLDELVYGDYLERNRLRIVGGTPYPDGRTFRPTLYLADDPD